MSRRLISQWRPLTSPQWTDQIRKAAQKHILLTTFHLLFKICEKLDIMFVFDSKLSKVIATNFCTCHDSHTVMTCAKICSNLMIVQWIKTKYYLHEIWMVNMISAVRWAAEWDPLPCVVIDGHWLKFDWQRIRPLELDNGHYRILAGRT